MGKFPENRKQHLEVMKTIRPFFTKTALASIAFGTLLATTSCMDEYFISGNHASVTEERYARNFDEVAVSGSFDVLIVPGDHFSIHVTAESNLIDYIETEIEDGKLKIYTRNIYSLHYHEPMVIEVVCPRLEDVKLSGSGEIKTGMFICDDFEATLSGSGKIIANIDALEVYANISGSGDIILEGTARESEFNISGSGKIHAYDFPMEYCEAGISGSGSMYINVSKIIQAAISGSGNVFYINQPEVHARLSGSGKVIDRN